MNTPIKFNRLERSIVMDEVRRKEGGALVWVVMISRIKQNLRAPLKIQFSSLCGVAHKKLLLTYYAYAAAQFFARALPSFEI